MAESFCRAARCRAVMPRGPCAAASQAMPLLMPQVRSRSTCGKKTPLRLIMRGTAYDKALQCTQDLQIWPHHGNRAAQDRLSTKVSRSQVARQAGRQPACFTSKLSH